MVDVGPTSSWAASVKSPIMALLGLGVMMVAGGTVWLSADGAAPSIVTILLGALVVAVGAFTASLSSLSVVADGRGLLIRSRLTRLVIVRIRLETIATAKAEMVYPSQWGGWGYRILPARRALVLHTGTGIVVTQNNGRRFAVTVDGAEQGAAALQNLVALQQE